MFAGPPESSSILDMEATQILIVKQIILHPHLRHHQHFSSNNLALVSLYEPLSFTDSVEPVCLGSENFDQCSVVGWRKASDDGKTKKNISTS